MKRKLGRAVSCAAGALLLAAFRVAPAPALAEAPPVASYYETVPLADGVFAFISTKKFVPNGNTLVVVGDDGVLVVDAGSFPSIARQMIAEIRRKTDKPVRYLVHTHWHEDHWLGDTEYRKAFPGVVLVSTEFTRQRMAKEIPTGIQRMLESEPKYAGPLREALARGTKADGTPIDEATRRRYEAFIADLEFSTAEFKQVVPTLPDLTFEKDLRVFLGKREVRVLFLGRGNTAGDAVTFVPDARVVASGDLIVAPTPFSLGSYPGEWIETLQKVLALDAVAIVPGHGPVLRDTEYPQRLIRMLTAVRSQVAEAVRAGATLEQARERVDFKEFRKQFAGDDPGLVQAFDAYFATPSVERAYQEATGKYEVE